jgi:hypothetical protein
MMRTKTITEELYFCIYIPRTWGYDQMGGYEVPEKIFYDEPFVTDETAEMYLAIAKKQHKKKPHHAYAGEPILEKYWKVLSEEIEEG